MLRYSTSGESHGICLIAVLEGMVAGLKLDTAAIDHDLWRRQQGYGRGGRMLIETDRAELLTGIRQNETIGGPIAMRMENKDFKINQLPVVHRPRPGHADLVGAMKYNRRDVRDILERASARETTARVAVGAVCRQFLGQFGVAITSHVTDIGGVKIENPSIYSYDQIAEHAEKSPVRCVDPATGEKMMRRIDEIKAAKDTVGGVFEVRVKGLPPGLGSFTTSEGRLDARLAFALMSIQAVKGVEFGLGFAVAHTPGSSAHDEIFYNEKTRKFFRKTNRAGGLEGSMSTGEELVIRAAAKPYATLMKPLASTNIQSKAAEVGTIERSDVTAVPACGVVGESMAAFELAKIFLEKFGGDSLSETRRNYDGYLKQVEDF
ncbi:MAG: chorismate synthase [Candidatus Omnitrophica bacterium]|nr:chorismate synthase [Candidatus Omnitrophota bacterium]